VGGIQGLPRREGPGEQTKKMLKLITKSYINRKCRKTLKKLNTGLDLPAAASMIKKVLVFLPKDLPLLEEANLFTQKLRETYNSWTVDIFDVDKLKKEDYNRLKAPNNKIVENLKDGNYELVIDLNKRFNLASAYLAVMTGASYRVNLDPDGSSFYNIQYTISGNNNSNYDHLLSHLLKLFPKS
jgi:hypothetical protein